MVEVMKMYDDAAINDRVIKLNKIANTMFLVCMIIKGFSELKELFSTKD